MAFFEWSDDLTVNIAEIDSQHRRLIDVLDEMYTAVMEDRGKAIVRDVVTRMIDYAAVHFAAEEQAMIEADYPELEAHRKEHEHFRATALRMKDAPDEMLSLTAIETSAFLKEYLVAHIQGTDLKMGQFLKARR